MYGPGMRRRGWWQWSEKEMKPMERYSHDGFSESGVFFMNAYGGKSIVAVQ